MNEGCGQARVAQWDGGVEYGCVEETTVAAPTTTRSDGQSSSGGSGGEGEQHVQGEGEKSTTHTMVHFGGLSRLYHCRYCVALRHPDQLAHEIEVYYASSNLREYKLANDARARRCRSIDSYACPLCSSPLQMTKQASPEAEDATAALLYLCCSYCHWTSLGSHFIGTEAEIAERVTEAMQANTHARFNELLGHFKGVVAEDIRLEQHQKHFIAAMNYRKTRVYHMHPVKKLPSKAQLLQSVRDRIGKRYDVTKGEWVTPPRLKTWGDLSTAPNQPAQQPAQHEFENTDLSSVASLQQRFEALNTQPHFTRALHPVFERYTAKTSLRCRVCQHNVVRPELGPDSSKFKIAQFASNHVPRVVILQKPDLSSPSPEIVLGIENPRDYVVNISFSLPEPAAGNDGIDGQEAGVAAEQQQQQPVEVVVPDKPVPVPQYEPLRSVEDEVTFDDDPPCVVHRALSGTVQIRLPLRVNRDAAGGDDAATETHPEQQQQKEPQQPQQQRRVHTLVNMQYQHHVVQLKARAHGNAESSVVSVVTPLRLLLS
ncbi:hypothetical protein PTSG_07286 [Salpingoeca rosetta]|uniref:Dynactin subunit 4 n=1 Tax=Salpingoeca rosetta (strain ATCC 50818 / BSB-021) TaxID=946362 RepID=F2UIZ7_SALR5|nr:uncharacterized protein PTSG_07286 [Salpingoeca rosetta]EGD76945.1 hypothetical protein PTSG_07286 [Salpingoeca rosetta]|eukprot:XP_004990785.1 hypothetical protein PTSG_07286 [Salpingoeca rosetta]